jgi:outer membrane protein assembly factor BamA
MRIAQVLPEGNTRTKRQVILREISIKTGDSVWIDSLPSLIFKNKLRLFNLQLFNEVDQQTDTTGGEITWHIRVKERWYILPSLIVQFADRNLNTWWVEQNHELQRTSVGVTITDKNFRGRLESLAVTAQVGYTQKLAVSYMRPYLNKGLTHGLGITASVAQSRQTYYATIADKLTFTGGYNGPVILRQMEGGLSYLYRPAYATRHMLQLNYKDFSVSDTVLLLNPRYYADGSKRARFLELFYRYEYNNVDNWNYSLKGQKMVVQAALRKGIEGIDMQSYVNVEAATFHMIAPKWYIAGIFRGRLMLPERQPYFFRSGLGTQTDYVRGYEYYVIDGGNYGLIRLNLKRELFNNTYHSHVKYFTAMPLRIYPKLFVDAGYINSPEPGTSKLSNQWLYSIGAGIDVVTLYDIKLRFEFAYNHLSKNGLFFHTNSE